MREEVGQRGATHGLRMETDERLSNNLPLSGISGYEGDTELLFETICNWRW
jgi:hypothetical protein